MKEENNRGFRFLLPFCGFIIYGVLVSVGIFAAQYIIYNFFHWEGFGDIIIMLMLTPVVYLVPLVLVYYFFLKRFRFGAVILSILFIIYPVVFFVLTSQINQFSESRYDNSSNCSSVTQWDCQSGYHDATFTPVSNNAKKTGDLNVCKKVKEFKDYSMMWSESTCVARAVQFNLPDIDKNEKTYDYTSSFGGKEECHFYVHSLDNRSFAIRGVLWSHADDVVLTHTDRSGDILCFYEYEDLEKIKDSLRNHQEIKESSIFFNHNNTLIQYTGENTEILSYLKNKFTILDENR